MTELPGEDLVRAGLRDLERKVTSVESLLTLIAAPRLRRLGLSVSSLPELTCAPELALYRLLGQREVDPYSAYNALLRRLISYAQALEARQHVADGSSIHPDRRP